MGESPGAAVTMWEQTLCNVECQVLFVGVQALCVGESSVTAQVGESLGTACGEESMHCVDRVLVLKAAEGESGHN